MLITRAKAIKALGLKEADAFMGYCYRNVNGSIKVRGDKFHKLVKAYPSEAILEATKYTHTTENNKWYNANKNLPIREYVEMIIKENNE